MNRDVFLSILAMDAYNRGYGAGVGNLPESGLIGNATIRPFQVNEQSGWQTAGFYAIAYDWAHDGRTDRVIAFRGTNLDFGAGSASEFFNSPFVKDFWNGWSVGAGFAGDDSLAHHAA
jgi:hypothetical protein